MIQDTFIQNAKFYDLVYQDKKYQSELRYISKFFFKNKNNSILEAGCGTGNYTKFLSNHGKVIAVDKSSEMIKLAKIKIKNKNKNKNIKFYKLDILKFKKRKKFDIIILLFHVINFIKNKKDLDILFKNFLKFKKSQTIIIFDFYNYLSPGLQKSQINFKDKKKEEYIKKSIGKFNNRLEKITIKQKIIKSKNNKCVLNQNFNLKFYKTDKIKKILDKYKYKYRFYKWGTFKKLNSKDKFGLCVIT
jgi:SAM-dependent methyltransferase